MGAAATPRKRDPGTKKGPTVTAGPFGKMVELSGVEPLTS